MWPPVTICYHVNISTQNQPKWNQVQSWDRGCRDHSSLKQLRKLIFAQPEELPTTVFHFLKKSKLHQEFLVFSCFYLKHGNMYILGLSSILFIQKLSACKEFKLLRLGFGQKITNPLRNSLRQIWKQKQFYSNSKKNRSVSFASYSFPMGIYSIDIY